MTLSAAASADTSTEQSAFMTHLNRIHAMARFRLRHIRCRDTRDDLMAEIVALAWKWFLRLTARGRNPGEFISTLAMRCSQAVRAGRRLVRSESPREVLSAVAKVRHGFNVTRLGVPGRGLPENLAELLLVDPKARVDEQASFRIDFPRWRAGFKKRDRDVLDALAAGGRTDEIAAQFQISPARVSQLRRAFLECWHAFHRGQRR